MINTRTKRTLQILGTSLYSIIFSVVSFAIDAIPIIFVWLLPSTFIAFFVALFSGVVIAGFTSKIQIFLSLPFAWLLHENRVASIIASVVFIACMIGLMAGCWFHQLEGGWSIAAMVVISLAVLYEAIVFGLTLADINQKY